MANINNNISSSSEEIYDPNKILDNTLLSPICSILSDLDKGSKLRLEKLSNTKIDFTDVSKIEKWYKKYKALYSYPDNGIYNLTIVEKKVLQKINKEGSELGEMDLVEISIGRLLEKRFIEQGHNVRIRKTTKYDDVFAKIDYIVEFLGKNKMVIDVIGVDLTVSNNETNLIRKKLEKTTTPMDYFLYHSKKIGNRLEFMPRLLLKLDRDLAYSFTKNYFLEIIEKGDILDAEEINTNFEYAIEDLDAKNKLKENLGGFNHSVTSLVNNTTKQVYNLTDL